MGWTKEKQADRQERGEVVVIGGGREEGGWKGGTEHVFEVALLIPIQMSERARGRGRRDRSDGWEAGEGRLSEGKTRHLCNRRQQQH